MADKFANIAALTEFLSKIKAWANAQFATKAVATTSADGLLSSTDKTKLNGIATGATAVSESTVSGWGFTKNTGTITGVKMNGASKGTSGVVDLGTVITAHQDISGKQDKITAITAATTQALYPIKIDTQGHITAYGSAQTIPIVENSLTSDSTTNALSAAQGKALKGLVDGKANTSHTHSADNILGGYLNIHPENGPTLIPFMNNDIAYLLKRGGSAVIKYDGTTQSLDLTNVFDASPSYWAINPTGVTTIIIELTLHKVFTWTNNIYVDFGSASWRSTNVKFEVMNTNYSGDTWSQKYNNTNNSSGHCYAAISHTPVGASNAGGGFNKVRFTFSGWANATIFRIAQLGIYNYGSAGLRETFLPKDGGPVYGTIYPYSNNGANLGGTSNYFNNAYITNINGVAVGSSPKFTDTTYSAEKGITLASGNKFGHSNSAITAQTTQAVYPIKIDAYGHITAYGSAVTIPAAVRVKGNSESSYRTGDVNLTAANIGAAASSHTHGNIQNGGTLQTNDITIASGDKLVVTDSSDSNKVARASISFDGSTTTKFLSKKGTFETPSVSVTITEDTTFNISGTTFKIELVS